MLRFGGCWLVLFCCFDFVGFGWGFLFGVLGCCFGVLLILLDLVLVIWYCVYS